MIVLAGALLKESEDLLRMGIKPTEVASGYELALEKALNILELVINSVDKKEIIITNNLVTNKAQKRIICYDKNGEQHYSN